MRIGINGATPYLRDLDEERMRAGYWFEFVHTSNARWQEGHPVHKKCYTTLLDRGEDMEKIIIKWNSQLLQHIAFKMLS